MRQFKFPSYRIVFERLLQLGLVVAAILMTGLHLGPTQESGSKEPIPKVSPVHFDDPVVIVTIDSLDLMAGSYDLVTVDLKINGMDDAVILDSSDYQVKWKSKGADECMRVAPTDSAIGLSGSMKVSPLDKNLYPKHRDGMMYTILCKNQFSKSLDSVYLFPY